MPPVSDAQKTLESLATHALGIMPATSSIDDAVQKVREVADNFPSGYALTPYEAIRGTELRLVNDAAGLKAWAEGRV